MAPIDAIAVGGGPGGAAFALELARHGKRVMLLERTRGPQPKVCGDFLSGEAQELLAYLGLDLATLHPTAITTLRLDAGKCMMSTPLPSKAAGLSRLRLDEALLAAAGRAGAEVVRGVTVTGLAQEGTDVLVRTEERIFHAKAAALAAGKHNVRGWRRARSSTTAFKMQFTLAPTAERSLAEAVYLMVYDGGYIGACLTDEGAATISWLLDEGFVRPPAWNWSAQLAQLASGSAVLHELLQGAVPRWAKPAAVSAVPLGYLRRTTIASKVFPVGDQLAVVPPFTGDGACLALASGIAAARAVLEGRDAAVFQTKFLAGLRSQFCWAAAVSASLKTEVTRRLGARVVAAFPWLATGLIRLTRFRGDIGLAMYEPPR